MNRCPYCAGEADTDTYPVEVYCSRPDCFKIALAICANDTPTCDEHGHEHTCGK